MNANNERERGENANDRSNTNDSYTNSNINDADADRDLPNQRAFLQTAKQSRYDRQIRIWGADGQQSLERAKIVLFTSTATACECAKNLILGGVKSVTIVDNELVRERDTGNNFMVSVDDFLEQKKRAECVVRSLKELNEFVEVSFVDEDSALMISKMMQQLQQSNSNSSSNNKNSNNEESDINGGGGERVFLEEFDLVVAAQLSEHVCCDLDEICTKMQKKLVTIRSHGCFGTVKISGVSSRAVVESKPDDKALDLRLEDRAIFKELQEYAETFEDLEAMDEQTFAHVPYACLLLIAKKRFLNEENLETLDGNSVAQTKFKEFLKKLRRTKTELNFEEAIEKATYVWLKPEVPKNVRECFERIPADFKNNDANTNEDVEMTSQPSSNNNNNNNQQALVNEDDVVFWTFVAALEEFSKQNSNYLPLDAGALPDMTSTTDAFVGLQKIYRDKAQKDQREILKIVRETIVPNLQRNATNAGNSSNSAIVDYLQNIAEKKIEEYCVKFCKNARDIRFVAFKSLKEERAIWKCENKPELEESKRQLAKLIAANSAERVCAYSYALLRASDAFEAKLCRQAGTYSPEEGVKDESFLFHRMTSDCAELRALVMKDLEPIMFQGSSSTTTFATTSQTPKLGSPQSPLRPTSKTETKDKENERDDDDDDDYNAKEANSEASAFLEALAWEVVRSQGGEIHAVASVVGGIASQEAIKLITGQFVPSLGRVCVHLGDGSSCVLP